MGFFIYICSMTIDNALLRFKSSLKAALELGDSKVANVFSWDALCIRPDQEYLQISNFDTDVNFGGDYKAELIGFCGTVYKDITNNAFIYQGYSSITGKQNIAVELVNVGDMYPHWGKPVILRITHTVGDLVIYSNPFHVSYTKKDVLRLDYRGYGTNNGVDYTNFNFMQSFGVKGYYDDFANNTELTTYQQAPRKSGEMGAVISQEQNVSIADRYPLLQATSYQLKKLIGWVGSPRFYINGVRYTACTVTPGKRLGSSNFYDGEILGYPDETDIYTPTLQIATDFYLTLKSPIGIYKLDTLPSSLTGIFNRAFTMQTGTVRIYNSANSLVKEYTQDDISIVGNQWSASLAGIISENDSYYVLISEGLFISIFGESFSISDVGEWTFTVTEGDYDEDDYENDDYFT